MRKILLCLVLCFSSLCWGQDVDVLGDWGEWNTPVDDPAQADILLDKLETTPEQVFAPQETDPRGNTSTDQPVTFGVGLNGSDEQQLNFLDGSSLMDYENVSDDVAGQEGDVFEGEFYFDESGFDQFNDDETFSQGDIDAFDEFDAVDDLDGFDETTEFEEF